MNLSNFVGGDGRECNVGFGDPIVWLEKKRTLFMGASMNGDYLLVPFSAAGIGGLAELLVYIEKLVCEVSGLPTEEVLRREACRYLDGRRFARPGIGLFARTPELFSNAMQQEIDTALLLFFGSILEGQDLGSSGTLLSMDVSEKTKAIVDVIVEGFFDKNTSTSVGEELLIKSRATEIPVKGAFRAADGAALPDPVFCQIHGEIDGIRGKNRSVYILDCDGKTRTLFFDEAKFKSLLRDKVLDGCVYSFVIKSEWVSHQKSLDYLESFELCVDQANALI